MFFHHNCILSTSSSVFLLTVNTFLLTVNTDSIILPQLSQHKFIILTSISKHKIPSLLFLVNTNLSFLFLVKRIFSLVIHISIILLLVSKHRFLM